jgi:hypothetical protein
VFFDANEYSPESLAGRRLLAHELTHVLQQRGTDAGGRPTVATDGSPLVQRSVPGSAPSAASQRQLAEFRSMVEQFRRLQATGELSSEEVAEVESAIREAEAAVRNAREVRGAGSSLRAASGVALGATGVLVADDATGIGVADDVAIPFTLLAAGVLAAGAWALGSSEREIRQSGEAAERAVSEAISAIGQILLAKRVGEQVRSLTGQVAIHLARFLGEAVGGRPPDHQNDPENDRPHWWREIKNFVRQIKDKGLSDRQLLRELRKRFSDEQLGEIRRALREVARRMGEDPPNFPPAVP